MISIRIEIPLRIWPTKLWRNKIVKTTAPQSWNELTRKQLVKFTQLLYSVTDKAMLKLLSVRMFFGISKFQVIRLTEVQVIESFELFKFLLEDNQLTTQLLPYLKPSIFSKKLYGPGDGFKYLKPDEWMFADAHYMEYRNSEKVEDLQKFVACLYRGKRKKYKPKAEDFNGEIRKPFNSHHLEAITKKIAKCSLWELLAIKVWYDGCRAAWENEFDKVFTADNESTAESYGWAEVFMKMSGSTFGTMAEVEKQPMYNLLFKMQVDTKDHEEAKRKNKKA